MRRQRGFALMLTVLMLLMAGAAVFLDAQLSASQLRAQRTVDESHALAAARDALIAYALAGGENGIPGALPCPDLNGDGHAGKDSGDADPYSEGNISCQAHTPVWLGRLPRATLDIDTASVPEDVEIWYALDRDFLAWDVVNPGSDADLEINGADDYAAVLILAGDPVEGQANRPSNDIGDYLEGENDTDDKLFEGCSENDCNDRVIGIEKDELFDLVRERLLGEVRIMLEDIYAGAPGFGFYPWAADLGDASGGCDPHRSRGILTVAGGDCVPAGYVFKARESEGGPIPDWIIDNHWYRYVYYAVAESCAGPGGAGSCTSDLLSLDGVGEQAVVFGIPRDINAYRDDHPDEVDVFNNLDERMRSIAAP